MRILMPVDCSAFSKAAVAFVASRETLLKQPTEVQLINIQAPVSMRVARALGKEIVLAHYDTEAAKALKPAAVALKRAGANPAVRSAASTSAMVAGDTVPEDFWRAFRARRQVPKWQRALLGAAANRGRLRLVIRAADAMLRQAADLPEEETLFIRRARRAAANALKAAAG